MEHVATAKCLTLATAAQAARFVAIARNPKLGPVSYEETGPRRRACATPPYVCCTYTAIAATCPETCRFRYAGCYAEAGFTKFLARKLDSAAVGLSPEDVILQEVREINDAFGGGRVPQDGARGGRDLRLHVCGDVGSAAGAGMLAKVAKRWDDRDGGAVWTPTHRWQEIPRRTWGDRISVLASVEVPQEIGLARSRGYPAVIVVEAFPNGAKAFHLPGSRAQIIPCPAQTRPGTTCIRCRLCLDRDLLKIGAAIGLLTHGPGRAAANAALRSSRRRGSAATASSGERSCPHHAEDATDILLAGDVVDGEGTYGSSPRAAGRGV